MKRVQFSFTTKLTFDDDVHSHTFALRVIPPETTVQHIISCSLNISPFTDTLQTMDAFGNNVTSGYLSAAHRFLDFSVHGSADIDLSKVRTDYMPCYLYQSAYTKPDADLRAFYEAHRTEGSPAVRAAHFSDVLSEIVTYSKDVTTTKTTAAEAFALKKGVCQDFAHILLSLLRMDKIACRYIAGLAFCDGETHAWVEYWDGKCWNGIDPANNCSIAEEYLVLSQGRDFSDCAIDRGVMLGSYTRQLQLVRSVLQEVCV